MDRSEVSLGCSQCSQCVTEVSWWEWAAHLDLQCSSALQHVAADLLQQVKGTGAALDLQGWKHTDLMLEHQVDKGTFHHVLLVLVLKLQMTYFT